MNLLCKVFGHKWNKLNPARLKSGIIVKLYSCPRCKKFKVVKPKHV
jgi:hypothetical protein